MERTWKENGKKMAMWWLEYIGVGMLIRGHYKVANLCDFAVRRIVFQVARSLYAIQ